MADPALPNEALLDRDGWELANAEERFEAADRVYWLPDRGDRAAIGPGDLVKLIFRILQSAEREAEGSHHEWMWVEVGTLSAGRYHGVLTNEPHFPGRTSVGMPVWFGPEHIVDIIKPDGWRSSEGEDILKCSTHGLSDTTFVCKHLAGGGAELGFHTSEEPWPGNRRPDAWCDACDAVVQEHGSWEAAEENGIHANIAILCGGCYDRCRERNVRGEGPAQPIDGD